MVFAALMMCLLLFLSEGYAAKNCPARNYPYFSGNYAGETTQTVDALTVVSYNIWFGQDIDRALLDLKEIESQKGLDVVLLQEMDEKGTEQIAQELQLNYAYYPAAIEPTYDKNFGNAILSKWPIVDSQKLILPHKSLSNSMNRIATSATIRIPGGDILVYSTHTESIFTLPQFREDQYTAILGDVRPDTAHVIIGGDFNSFTEAEVEELEAAFRKTGYMRASKGSGNTIVRFGMEITSDHIFTRGFVVEATGKLAEAGASDHLPVWVTLKLR